MVEISILGKCREVSSSSKISEQTVHYHCTFSILDCVQHSYPSPIAAMETITYTESNSIPKLQTDSNFDLAHYSVSVSVDEQQSDEANSDHSDTTIIKDTSTAETLALLEDSCSAEDDAITVVAYSQNQSSVDLEEKNMDEDTIKVVANGFISTESENDKLTQRKLEPDPNLSADEEIDLSTEAKELTESSSLYEAKESKEEPSDNEKAPVDTEEDVKPASKVVDIPILKLTRATREDCKSWCLWLFDAIQKVLDKYPEHVALIMEVGERKHVTYSELMKNVNRAANYLHHHGVVKGAHVVICMNNRLEFVYFQLGLYLIGAVPVLLNPSHVGSGRFPRFECTAVLVDDAHYSHVLRLFDHFVGAKQIFVFTNELGSLCVPRFVWIIDGNAFVDFPSKTNLYPDSDSGENDVVAFSTSGTSAQKSKIVAHGSDSAHRLCTQYLDVLMAHLADIAGECRTHLLVTSGFHTVDGWSLLLYSLISDQTLIITESNSDVWAVSSLDRIADLIRIYDVALITSNAQFLKSFVKYETEKLYDINSLKVVSYSGSILPGSVAKKFRDATGASLIHSYSTTECGPISCGLQNFEDLSSLSCGSTFEGINVKISDTDEENELGPGEWGYILLQTPIKCSHYFGDKISDTFDKNKYMRTGDIGMLDEQQRLYVAGPADGLLTLNEQTIVSPLMENALLAHPAVEDAVVAVMNEELTAGVVVKEGAEPPTLEELNELGKGLDMGQITKLVFVDFIPRSETGKLLRSEVLFLLQAEDDGRIVGTCVV